MSPRSRSIPRPARSTLVRYTAVDDYGRLINPLLTEGQVQGGVAQGIGQAMLEHTVYDAASGQLLSGSLMDYALPRADDFPYFDIELIERPTAANPLGVKGSGQAGCIAAPQTDHGGRSSMRCGPPASRRSTCRRPPSACGAR